MNIKTDLAAGVHNLLENCAQLKKGEKILVVQEDPKLGWYDEGLCRAVVDGIHRRQATALVERAGLPTTVEGARIKQMTGTVDATIFLSRVGDQDRFADAVPGQRSVMVYARSQAMLASRFGCTDHAAMAALKDAVNEITAAAQRIDITCPLGTKLSGAPGRIESQSPADVSVLRFPMAVPAPISGAQFSGQVALARFLTPTGSRLYEPPSLTLADTVIAEVAAGRIVDFTGAPSQVAEIRTHYERVASAFDLEPYVMHSWHAGIHPACAYLEPAADNPDRWSNTIFCNPRFVHFHTCGLEAPGEICWMVLDPTITLDGVNLWENGRLMVDNFAESRVCLAQYSELVGLFEQPETRIGV